MRAVYFGDAAAFRAWLEEHHATAKELLLGFHKVGARTQGIAYGEAVDEALCFGWIDAVRKRVDDERYTIRFTPRKPRSTWSLVNVEKMKALLKEGRVHPAGKRAFEARTPERTGIYSFEQRKQVAFDAALERAFRAQAKAWAWYVAQAPSYQYTARFWVMSAKQQATRERRLQTLIACSAGGLRVPPLRRSTDPQPGTPPKKPRSKRPR